MIDDLGFPDFSFHPKTPLQNLDWRTSILEIPGEHGTPKDSYQLLWNQKERLIRRTFSMWGVNCVIKEAPDPLFEAKTFPCTRIKRIFYSR